MYDHCFLHYHSVQYYQLLNPLRQEKDLSMKYWH